MPDHHRGRARVLILAVLFLCQLPAADQTEFFEKRIRPVLVRSCYPCHSRATAKPMGGIRLDTRDETRRVIGTAGDSRLLQAIAYNGKIKMPPAGKLSADEIADFTEWVRSGAPDPRDAAQPETRQLWSLRPIQDPAPPPVQSAWVRSPIDAFILDKLQSRGLTPAPAAGKRVLIRRVTYDLTGLPPTPAEVAAFLDDASPQAFEHLVDRLLASPHYGERWARHWLDLVRYAETNGHEFDNEKLTPWRYRDYVIRAFNQDVPYNQFVREHIAGDLLPRQRMTADGAALESPLGTTFYWFGEVLNSATDPVKSRADEVDNQIDVAGKAFLGLTVACARCHDHKFDPIPTADYYAVAGVFHSTGMREDVIDSPQRAQAIQALSRQIRAAHPPPARVKPKTHYRPQDEVFENFEGSAFANWTVAGAAFGDAPDHGSANSLAGGDDRFVGTLISRKFRTGDKLYLHVRLSGTPADPKLNERGLLRFTLVNGEYKAQHIVPAGPKPVWKTMTLTLERNRVCYFEIVDRSTSGHIAVDQIVFSDLKDPPPTGDEAPLPEARAPEAPIPPSEFAMIAADSEPHNVKIHMRGSHQNLGAEVPRGFLRAIAGANQPPITAGSGRLQIADWFAGEHNPLTARVMVNRIWKHHFGAGLVRTPDNFGAMGEAPSNPELLDWLATRFIESGWSVKAMQRRILLSSAYRMSSRDDAAAATADPENKLLHRMPVQRLEPEAIRDAILSVAGTLDPQLYGPSIPPYISKYQNGRGKPESGPLDGAGRRSIYIQVRRNFLPSLFLAFDYPLPVSSIGARSVSTVPSQALLMMNNEFVAQQAAQWARRAMAATDSPAGRVDYLYEAAFSRLPAPDERNEVLSFVQRAANPTQGWSDAAHVLLNSAEFIYVQ